MTIEATPSYFPQSTNYVNTSIVKPATPDVIVFDNSNVPIDQMTDLLFENIGGQEIITIARNDIVNGQKISYSPIKNLSELAKRYGSFSLFVLPNTSETYFKNFSINLTDNTPEYGNGTGPLVYALGTSGITAEQKLWKQTQYIDETTGDLVVNVVSMASNNQVEIQILSGGIPFGDILY